MKSTLPDVIVRLQISGLGEADAGVGRERFSRVRRKQRRVASCLAQRGGFGRTEVDIRPPGEQERPVHF